MIKTDELDAPMDEPHVSVTPTKPISDTLVFKYGLSVCAALVAETVTYPLDLTKTRLQIQGEVARPGSGVGDHAGTNVTHQMRRGMVRTALGIGHHQLREEGPLKLWQGVTPALYRHVVYTGCRMSCYEFVRDNILGRNADGTISVWKAVIGGLFAGAFGQFMASPTDLVKVQMQMEGRRRLEGHPPRVRNTAHAFKSIVQSGGFRGLWKGWVPNVQRAALVNMGDLATYDTSKHLVMKYTRLTDNYVTHTIASVLSGLVAASVGTPADVVKTRVMNQPTHQGRGLFYKSSFDCLVKTVRDEGFLALYKGFIPIWARMAPWSLTFWLTYEQVRRLFGATSF